MIQHFLFDAANGLTLKDFLDYLSRASIITFLILVVYGGYRKWWVFGWVYKESQDKCDLVEQEKDAWRNTALQSAQIATSAFRELERNTK